MRVALVTGAGRGIGAATTHRLAKDGYHVVAVDWCTQEVSHYPQASEEELEAVAAPYEGRVITHIGDVRDPWTTEGAAAAAVEHWGRLDVAVAGASVIAGRTALWETPSSELDLLWGINTLGVWNTAAAAIPAMLSGPDPTECRFVAIASAAASHGLFHLTAYNTVKHAVVGMVRGLAADLVGTGVTASVVSPGSTRTEMLQATAELYGVSVEDMMGHQLVGRILEPEEIADTIAFCCSPAGGVVNGTIVHADGGFRP